MEKQEQANSLVSLPFSIEFFGLNGSSNISGDQSVVVTKMVTSFGKSVWGVIHNN
jgi:hypothetical protein